MSELEKFLATADKARTWLNITDEDLATLREHKEVLLEVAGNVIEDLLKATTTDEELIKAVKEAGFAGERLEEVLRSAFASALDGSYDEAHARRFALVGLAHARRGAPPLSMVLTAGVLLANIMRGLAEVGQLKGPLASALCKSVAWHLCVMLEAYELARATAVEEAAGISRALCERLAKVGAEKAYAALKESVSGA